MDDTATWPPALRAYLSSQYGEYTTLRRLYGLSHNQVWEAVFPTTHLVVKATQNAIEPYAYRSVAPFLGDAMPRLEWSQTVAAQHWLVLEYIPNPLPPERWLADPDVLALLHRLHQTKLPATDLALYSPEWSDEMTNRVLEYFILDERVRLQALLRALQAAAQPLFQPICWISGDPNRRNWGVRNDGTVVLYDWERLGRGTPALDLAITVPGLADWVAFTQVAAGYLALSAAPEIHLPELSRHIALAKAWSLVEFLHEVALDQAADTSMVPDLLERLLPWIIQISEWIA